MMMKWNECLELAKCLRRKMYITPLMARQYAPKAKHVSEFLLGMMTYEIKYDSISKFFNENNVTVILVDPHANHRENQLGIISCTTVVVKCIIAP